MVNEDGDTKTTIRVNNSKIILRGSGSGEGGTELFMKNTLIPRNVNEMWSTPPMFEFGNYQVGKQMGIISENVAEGSNQIAVSNAHKLKVGDWILISLNAKDTNLLRQEMIQLFERPIMETKSQRPKTRWRKRWRDERERDETINLEKKISLQTLGGGFTPIYSIVWLISCSSSLHAFSFYSIVWLISCSRYGT